MKYKAGDKVRIKDLETLPQVLRGRVMQIKRVYSNNYDMTELLCPVFWTDELIEGLVEEEDKTVKTEVFGDTIFYPADAGERLEIIRNNNYQFKDENGNVINATKIVLEKKKKGYPKTYKECCKILEIDNSAYLTSNKEGYWNDYELSLNNLIEHFRKLLICRDAYRKIAGEEIGLGKPWEIDPHKPCCFIAHLRTDGIIKKLCGVNGNANFAFPTEEMRDAFYENFKDLIEECKEFL